VALLAVLLFCLLTGVAIALPVLKRRTEAGWCLLIGPMSAVMVGVPVALLFGLGLPALPDPLLGLGGAWRAMPVGAAAGAAFGILIDVLSRNSRRRRTFSSSPVPSSSSSSSAPCLAPSGASPRESSVPDLLVANLFDR